MATLDSGAWRRLPPAAILHFAIKAVVDVVRHGWQGLAAGGVGIGVAGGEVQGLLAWLAVALLFALILLFGFLQYRYFRFRAGEDRIEVRQGVFQRQSLSLNYGRVQSVSLVQPIYYRPFHLVSLKLESAGSSGQEVDLAGISPDFAERVRGHVLHRRAVVADEPADAVDDATVAPGVEDERLVLHRSLGAIARHGLCSNNVWIFAAFAFSVFGAMEERLDTFLTPWLEAGFQRLIELGPAAVVPGALALGIALLLVTAALSVLASIVLHYDFRLFRVDNGLRARSGLLQTREASLTPSKAQCLVREQTPIGLLLGLSEARVAQAGAQPAGNPEQAATPSFVVPALDGAEFQQLVGLLYSDYAPQTEPLRAIDRAYIKKTWQYRWVAPALVVTAAGWIVVGPWVALALVFALAGLPLTALAHRRYGYAMGGGFGHVSSGLVGRSLSVFPNFKVQTVTLRQSPSQRRHGLATLRIELAGRRLKLPYMPLRDAEAWRDHLLHAAETDPGAWI